MITLRIKITKAELQEGTNRYGEAYKGYQCVGIEQNVPEGQYANKVTFFYKGDIQVGDIGTVNVTLDINNRGYMDTRVINWNCESQTGF